MAKDGYIPYRPKDWINGEPLTRDELKQFREKLRTLEDAELVESLRDGSERVTWIRLTPEGEKRAVTEAKRAGMDVTR